MTPTHTPTPAAERPRPTSARRARGESLALVLKALREHPVGLTSKQLAAETGIELVLCGVLLSQYRGAGHIESRGFRPQIWTFDGRPAPQRVLSSPGSSRVFAPGATYVAPDDFTPGAFMRDWMARRAEGAK